MQSVEKISLHKTTLIFINRPRYLQITIKKSLKEIKFHKAKIEITALRIDLINQGIFLRIEITNYEPKSLPQLVIMTPLFSLCQKNLCTNGKNINCFFPVYLLTCNII